MSDVRKRGSGGVQSVERALDILDMLTASPGALSVADFSKGTGLPYATTHRLVTTLAERGYMRQEPGGKNYELGPQVVIVGSQLALRLSGWLRPHLTQLMEISGETVNVAMLDNGYASYMAQAEPKNQLRMFTPVGSRVLPHSTAVGKVLLAHRPRAEVEETLTRLGMPARTENTITSIGPFLAELERVAAQGYAVDEEEREIGMRCVAVPLPIGSLMMAMSVSGPAGRLGPAARARLIPEMRRIAEQIASVLTQADQS